MHSLTKSLFFFALFLKLLICYAAPPQQQSNEWFSHDAAGVVIKVDLFISSTCPHCHKANAFLSELTVKHKWLKVSRHVINEEKSQLELFYQKLQLFHSNDFSVPTVMFCDSRWVGFSDSDTTGKGLLRALSYCYHQVEKEGSLTEVTRNTLRQWSATNSSNVKLEMNKPVSLLERIVISGLMEAVSPCSLFCLLMFLSFLWLYPDCRRARFYLGLLFILALGIMHTAQFVFTDIYQQWMLSLRWISLLTGFVLIAYVVQYYRVQWRSGLQRSALWTIPVILLGVATAYSYQQTCNFSVGALFQQWLNTQTMTPSAYAFCQLTYLVFYLLPLGCLFVFYLIFNVHPRRLLPVIGCLMLAAVGVLLLVYPEGLSSFNLSCVALFAVLFVAWRRATSIMR